MLLDWWDLLIEEDAATRIQAMWRGRAERAGGLHRISRLVLTAPPDRPNSGASQAETDDSVSSSFAWDQLIEADAASRIQASWRGWRSRQHWAQVGVIGRSASIVYAAGRPWSAASMRSVSSAASVSSSVAWQEFVENHAATTIQACWRARGVRQFVSVVDMTRSAFL